MLLVKQGCGIFCMLALNLVLFFSLSLLGELLALALALKNWPSTAFYIQLLKRNLYLAQRRHRPKF